MLIFSQDIPDMACPGILDAPIVRQEIEFFQTWRVQVILSKHIRITMEKQCNTYKFVTEIVETKAFIGQIMG